jgi:hypothetical protein
MITPNVDYMLRHLRHPIKQRCLWIDAICLNQADNAEKSVQVQLMGDIYRQVRKVHIWLGDADATVARVWSFLRTLVGRKAENLDIGEVEKILCDFSGKDGGEHLRNFVCRPWFTRRWIIQEASVNHQRVVHCGSYTMPWVCMVHAFKVIAELGSGSSLLGQVGSMVGFQNALSIQKQIPDLLELPWEFDTSECLDPRDRIYSLLGLAKDVGKNRLDGDSDTYHEKNRLLKIDLTVTYNNSWTKAYQQLCESCMLSGHGYEIVRHLLYFGSLWDRDSRLPSWVPDWSRSRLSQAEIHSQYQLRISLETLKSVNGSFSTP